MKSDNLISILIIGIYTLICIYIYVGTNYGKGKDNFLPTYLYNNVTHSRTRIREKKYRNPHNN